MVSHIFGDARLNIAILNYFREFQHCHGRTRLLIILAGSVVFSASAFAISGIFHGFKSLLAPERDLPIGLPNPRNICYLNALLQAMSANSSLVRFLKRSARLHPNRLLYCLVCILKGLRCSSRYIISNKLDDVLRDAHRMLLTELTTSKQWSPDDQQDAPELFSFFMDIACSRVLGRTASKATEGLSSVSQFIGPRYEHAVVPRCFHRSRLNGSTSAYVFRSPLRTDVFQRHLLANQVICTNCGYRSSPSLQAEACITLFLNPSLSVPTRPGLRPTLDTRCSQQYPSLYDYLSKEFGTSERLGDFLCPKCQRSVNRSCVTVMDYCEKERWIAHLPSCLVIHVQRGEWLGPHISTPLPGFEASWSIPGVAKKRSDYLFFPYRLNMTDYMLSAKNNRHSRQSSLGGKTMINDSCDSHIRRPHSYVLRSVLVHQGESVHTGHYVTYRTWRKADASIQRKRSSIFRLFRSLFTSLSNFFRALPANASVNSSPWVFTSDNQVFRVPPEEVRSCLAYLLFYEREPPQLRCAFTDSGDRQTLTCNSKEDTCTKTSCVTSEGKTHTAGWDHLESAGDALLPVNVGNTVEDPANFEDGDEDETDEEEEDSDVPSDFAEEEFIGSRAEVIRSLALAAARI